MSLANTIRGIVDRISDAIAARRRLADFTCGDCDRMSRCNLSPDDICTARQEQIERGDWKDRRTDKALLPARRPI